MRSDSGSKLSDEPGITSHAAAETIAHLVAERDALRAELERLWQREQKRKAKAEQKRADLASAEAALRAAVHELNAVRPSPLSQDAASVITARTRDIHDPRLLYLDLLKNCLSRITFGEKLVFDPPSGQIVPFDLQRRLTGVDWPAEAETMAGLARLDNVQHCVTDVLEQGVPGDLVETGVWRGGVTILMRGILRAYGDTERTVWVADSFAGLPVPDTERYEADRDYDLSTSAGYDYLAVSVDEVKANFARYGLLDEQVRFLVGWFRDTLPTAPIEQISVLRLDGDLYESTMDALSALYPKLAAGGFLIVDDYWAWEPCRRAVDEYRSAHAITEQIHPIDWTSAYWRRER